MFYVFDLDGTLADCTHRRHLLPNYDAFFAACVDDTPIHDVIDLLHALREAEHEVEIWSGRSAVVLHETCEWLENNNIPSELLTQMRPVGDHSPDDELKERWLMARDRKPDMIFDDRQRVVDMWRRNGITCAQVAPGDFDKAKVIVPNTGPVWLALMIGPSGAGKSSYLQYVTDKGMQQNVVSTDHIRELICGDFKSQDRNKDVFAALENVVSARLNSGMYTIVDATNLHKKDRLRLVNLLPEGGSAAYIVVDRPLEEKLRTKGWRPDWLIEKHHRTMQSAIKDILAGDGLPNVTVYDKREKVLRAA